MFWNLPLDRTEKISYNIINKIPVNGNSCLQEKLVPSTGLKFPSTGKLVPSTGREINIYKYINIV